MRGKSKPKKAGVFFLLDAEEHERLKAICASRGQSKTDFLRSALAAHDHVPVINRERPLVGACLAKHKAKLRRDARKSKKGEKR